MTDREKQIEEMARDICTNRNASITHECKECALSAICLYKETANVLYREGYRKQIEGEWEVRKGERWIGSEVCERYEYYACSRCGKRHDRSRDPYCPGCGAKMKGGGRE